MNCHPTLLAFAVMLGVASGNPSAAQDSSAIRSRNSVADAAKNAAHTSQKQETYVVRGFRSARFAADEKSVRAAIAKDFPVAAREIVRIKLPSEKRTGLIIQVPALEPGPAALVTYILEPQKGLIQVNVAWNLPGDPDGLARDRLAVAARQLEIYFRGYAWPSHPIVSGVPGTPNSLLVFQGMDAAGHSVEINVDGVLFSRMVDGEPRESRPSGPARLRLGYSAAQARQKNVETKENSGTSSTPAGKSREP